MFTVDPGLKDNLKNLLDMKRNKVDILKEFCEGMELTCHEATGLFRMSVDFASLATNAISDAIIKHGN